MSTATTWCALAESVTGTSHLAQNTPCQDASRFATFGPRSEWLVIVVADGAGSTSHSQIGATLTCDGFVRRVESSQNDLLFDKDAMIALFAEVRNEVVAEAERLGLAPRELACTALLAVVGPTSAAFGQIGDGAIIIDDELGHRTVFWPEPQEYANATDFLTDDRFVDVLLFDVITRPITEIAVLTDGIQRLALDFSTRAPHEAFFRPMFNALRTAITPESLAEPFKAFLDSSRVNDRTDDDKTLVLVVRRP